MPSDNPRSILSPVDFSDQSRRVPFGGLSDQQGVMILGRSSCSNAESP